MIVDRGKNQKILVNIGDISVMTSHIGIKIGKSCSHVEKCKKKKKKNHFGRYIGSIADFF